MHSRRYHSDIEQSLVCGTIISSLWDPLGVLLPVHCIRNSASQLTHDVSRQRQRHRSGIAPYASNTTYTTHGRQMHKYKHKSVHDNDKHGNTAALLGHIVLYIVISRARILDEIIAVHTKG